MTRRKSGETICLRIPRLTGARASSPPQERRGSGEHGEVLVETAMSLIVLLVLVFGLMKALQAAYTYHLIAESAREGTRYAIVRGSSCPTYGNFPTNCPASAPEIETYVEELGYPGINPSDMSVNVAWSAYPSGGTCTPSTTCNNPGNLVTVTVQYNFPLSIPFVPAQTVTMESTSAMVISD